MSPVLYYYINQWSDHVEYANSVWCPYKQGDITELEKIKKDLR